MIIKKGFEKDNLNKPTNYTISCDAYLSAIHKLNG